MIALPLFFVVSCSDTDKNQQDEKEEVTVASLKQAIKEMDDSLNVLTKKVLEEESFTIDRLVYHEAINRNLAFYKAFPDDSYAPRALEKASSMYMQLNIDQKAADWRDTLLNNYPDFEGRLSLLELQKSHYDNFEAYDPEMIKKYCNLMLAMEDQLSEEKKSSIEFRLEHIDKSFPELIKMQNPEIDL